MPRRLRSGHLNDAALLLAALAVPMDGGDEVEARRVLAAAASGPPLPEAWVRMELDLQAAMLEGFGGDPVSARVRLEAARRARGEVGPAMGDAYLGLAEAVSRFTAGDRERARLALTDWEQAVSASGHGAAARVGNEWAEERLRAALAKPG